MGRIVNAGWKNLREVMFIILCSQGFIQNRKLDRRKVEKARIDYAKLFNFLQGCGEVPWSLSEEIVDKIDLRPFEVKILERFKKNKGGRYEITADQFQRIMDWKAPVGVDVGTSSGILSKLGGVCKCFAEILLVCMYFKGISEDELAGKAKITTKTLKKYLQGEEAPAEKMAGCLADIVCPKEIVGRFLSLASSDNHKIRTRRIESTDPRSSRQLWKDAGLPIPETEDSEALMPGSDTALSRVLDDNLNNASVFEAKASSIDQTKPSGGNGVDKTEEIIPAASPKVETLSSDQNGGGSPLSTDDGLSTSEKVGGAVEETVEIQPSEVEASSADQKVDDLLSSASGDPPIPEKAGSGNGAADEAKIQPVEIEEAQAAEEPPVDVGQKEEASPQISAVGDASEEIVPTKPETENGAGKDEFQSCSDEAVSVPRPEEADNTPAEEGEEESSIQNPVGQGVSEGVAPEPAKEEGKEQFCIIEEHEEGSNDSSRQIYYKYLFGIILKWYRRVVIEESPGSFAFRARISGEVLAKIEEEGIDNLDRLFQLTPTYDFSDFGKIFIAELFAGSLKEKETSSFTVSPGDPDSVLRAFERLSI